MLSIANLPLELLSEIIPYLRISDRLALSCTSILLRKVCLPEIVQTIRIESFFRARTFLSTFAHSHDQNERLELGRRAIYAYTTSLCLDLEILSDMSQPLHHILSMTGPNLLKVDLILKVKSNSPKFPDYIAKSIFTGFENRYYFTNIYFCDFKLTETSIPYIAETFSNNSRLSEISIVNCGISSSMAPYFDQFLKSPVLSSLSLRMNPIGSGISYVCENLKKKHLLSIDLSETDLKDADIEIFSSFLQENATVRYVDLSMNSITKLGAESLGECLRVNSTLKSLELRNCIGDDVIYIFHGLRHNTSLTALNISENSITSAATASIGECLQHNSILEVLLLKRTQINSAGVSAIASGLNSNTTLKSLDFENCYICNTDSGIKSLSDALISHNTGLEELSLSNTRLLPLAVEHISRSLGINNKLKYLDLSWQNFPEESIRSLSISLKINSTLKKLLLYRVNLTSNGILLLVEAVCNNPLSKLEELDASWNLIDEIGATRISEILIKNQDNFRLGTIKLVCNSIGLKGVSALGSAFERCKQLKLVSVSVSEDFDSSKLGWNRDLWRFNETKRDIELFR